LQQFLGKNRKVLSDNGFLYPQSFCHDKFCHHKLYWLLNPENVSKEKKQLIAGENLDLNYQALKEEFDKSGAHSLVISSELFSNHDITSSLDKLRSFFKEFKINIIVYLRKQDDFLLSMYNQVVKNNRYTGTFTECFNSWKKIIYNINYADFLSSLEKIFCKDNIIVRIYEQHQFVGGSIYYDFIDCLEINDKLNFFYIPQGKRNLSLPHDMIEIKRFANSLDLDDDAHGKLIQLLAKKNRHISERKVISNHKIKNKWEDLIKNWINSNERTASRYFPGKGKLFHEPLDIANLSIYIANNQDDIERFQETLCYLTDKELAQLYKIISKSSKSDNSQKFNLIKKSVFKIKSN
jgi:hypothetical protein